MIRISIVCVFLVLASNLSAQKKLKLSTNGKGTLFFYGGYHRVGYASHNIDFKGSDYSFELENQRFSDNQEGESVADFFGSSSLQSAQAAFHVGYYVAHKWALTAGYDRMNFFIQLDEPSRVNGSFAPGSHSLLSGNYSGDLIQLTKDDLYYAQEKGVNLFTIGIQRTDKWYRARDASFSLNTNARLALGPIFSNTTFIYDAFLTENSSGFSGMGFYNHLSLRFDFFQHVFIQPGLNAGVISQGNVALRSITDERARHTAWFLSPQISIGASLFVRPTDGCGTCPKW